MTRSTWMAGAAAGLAAVSNSEKLLALSPTNPISHPILRTAPVGQFSFARDGVLGTSMDLLIDCARPADAYFAEQQILAEIGRLSRILSTYDPESEIRRVMAGTPIQSDELIDLLAAYEFWNERTDGAIDLNLAGVLQLWKNAARSGQLPDPAALTAAAKEARAWNVDALGKGFIIDRAVAAARRIVPSGLLNIGGDIRVWGEKEWLIGVADPKDPSENAPLLATTLLREAAIATSGGYARYFTIAGRRYSHLIDPRTLYPIDTMRSATFIAADAVTANALATTASIAGPEATMRVAQTVGAQSGLVVDSTGNATVSGGFQLAGAVAVQAAESAWPSNYQVAVTFTLKNPSSGRGGPGAPAGRGGPPGRGGPAGRGGPPGGPGGPGGAKRPYVALWIEDASGKIVRTIALWGSQDKYIPEMSTWWRKIGGNWRAVQAVSRATRAFGTYTLAWDGRNDAAKPVPAGNYSVCLEINREHGGHVTQRAVISCSIEPATAELKVTSESEASQVVYGPKTP